MAKVCPNRRKADGKCKIVKLSKPCKVFKNYVQGCEFYISSKQKKLGKSKDKTVAGQK